MIALIQASKLNITNSKVTTMAQRENHILLFWQLVFITATRAGPPNRIVKGNDARIGDLPHQVSIQVNEWHHCGGSIIDAIHILTAAHCIVDDNYQVHKVMDVVTGVIEHSQRTANNVFPVAKAFYHPNYETFYKSNDIGIVKLAKPIPFNSFQNKINLPTRVTAGSPEIMVISGWGLASWSGSIENSHFSEYLQKLDVRVISNEECQNRWEQQTYYTPEIRPTEICVLPTTKGAGMCLGDSGGPLTHKNEIIGVAAAGIPCGKGFPDIYTRVSEYLPWISWAIAQ